MYFFKSTWQQTVLSTDFNNDKNVLYLNNIDPDLHYFPFNFIQFLIVNCEYYTFNKRIDKDQVTSDSFSLLHMNIRSLPCLPKLQLKFQSYNKTLNLSFSIIGLTETWFNSSISNLYTIQGYKSINNSRTNKKEGGVALFVNTKYTV